MIKLFMYILLSCNSITDIFALPVRQDQGEEEMRKACSLDFKTLYFSGNDRQLLLITIFQNQTVVGTLGEFKTEYYKTTMME